jgi:protein-tyrosine phosphatase
VFAISAEGVRLAALPSAPMDVAVTHVEVEPDAEDGLLVQWGLVGDGPVDISVGPTPEAIDHAHSLRADGGVRSVRVRAPGPGRHYVSVAPHHGGSAVVGAERRLPFQGVTNFRDLGGYRTSSGGRTRWGQVFRADALHHLTTSDLVAFEGLGLRVVYDLRSPKERERQPNPVQSRELALLGPRPDGRRPDRSAFQRKADGERLMHEQYVSMLATAGPRFGSLLSGLAEPDGLPAVFHCAAGKDRTGLTAALLLTALGVPRETVLDDYELTARCWTGERDRTTIEWLLESGMSQEAAEAVFEAPRWVMAATLEALDDEYGGIDAYLRGPAEMDGTTLDELRGALVD